MRREFGVHFKLIFRRLALHEGDVFFHRLFRAEKIRQRDERGFVFGEQDHAADLGVEPVRVHQIIQPAFARPRFAAGDGGVEQLHQIRPLRILAVG